LPPKQKVTVPLVGNGGYHVLQYALPWQSQLQPHCTCLLAVVLLLLGAMAVLQPSRYIFLFTSKGVVYFVCFTGIVLLYFLLREDRA
jgi:hypothetical protein